MERVTSSLIPVYFATAPFCHARFSGFLIKNAVRAVESKRDGKGRRRRERERVRERERGDGAGGWITLSRTALG